MANETDDGGILRSPGFGLNSKLLPHEFVYNEEFITDVVDIHREEFIAVLAEETHATNISLEEETISDEASLSSPVNHDSTVEETESQGDETTPAMAEEGYSAILHPHKDLPRPAVPNNLLKSPSYPGRSILVFRDNQSESFPIDVPAIGKLIRERSSSLKAEISRRINNNRNDHDNGDVTQFTLSGVKVIVQEKEVLIEDSSNGIISITNHNDDDDDVSDLKGRVTFFSRSNCRDCRAVRSFLRERGLKYAEINVDVYPSKQKELMERTGSTAVPQIFFNEKLIGGLVALNSMRNSGVLEQRLREMLAGKCPDDAPEPVPYGFDDSDEEVEDRTVGIVRVLRQRLPIQDRLIKMRLVKNCFTGSDLVDVIVRHFGGCDRVKAVEIGKELARKHFIHHVFGGYDFQDGNKTYRFLEHELFIQKCFNFRGSADEREPQDAAAISDKLAKTMYAILESYASEDRRHVDYVSINNSEEFRRYLKLVQGLHRVDIASLSSNERLASFLNLYNAMVIHGMIRMGYPEGLMERKPLVADFLYLVGGHPYSLSNIKNGILRSNRRPLYSLIKPFNTGDARLELVLPTVNPLIHFGLCDGAKSCPTLRFFTPQNVEAELRHATREFFQRGGLEVDLAKRTVYLSRLFKWYNVDFGSSDREILNWIMSYLDASRAGLLTHLLSDGGVVNIAYQTYDWSLNS